ncbi:MAG: carbon storage regulator [Planctomycetes bacterium RBG_16_64_10]|nr:MAG: carbon storage regulator [Planctomycetes bacterium RBG_16_64_10]
MLVLSRRESQRIKLGSSIVVTVVRVSGDKVRLGIDAPSDVLILREELDPHERSDSTEAEETLEGRAMRPLGLAVAPRT